MMETKEEIRDILVFDADRLDPCLPNPCGAGECETTGSILNGYICRCYDGTIQLTNCSLPTSKLLIIIGLICLDI